MLDSSMISIMTDEHLDFQILDWKSYHENRSENDGLFRVLLFGRTMNDKSVCIKVCDFTPFFYVRVMRTWNKYHFDGILRNLKERMKQRSEKYHDYDISPGLLRYQIVQKKVFDGFQNEELCTFMQLIFRSETASNMAKSILKYPMYVQGKQYTLRMFESSFSPMLRFMHLRNISSCGWVRLHMSQLKENKQLSFCDLTYEVNWKHVHPIVDCTDIAPFKILGYDIECVSMDGSFPRADLENNDVSHIGNTITRIGYHACEESSMVCNGASDAIDDDTLLIACENEFRMFMAWAKEVRRLQPDVMAGHNTNGFDDKYIVNRLRFMDKKAYAQHHDPRRKHEYEQKFFEQLGKLNNKYLRLHEKVEDCLSTLSFKALNSSALNENDLYYLSIPGTINIDTMKVIQREHKLDSYALDAVSATFIREDIISFERLECDDEKHAYAHLYSKSSKSITASAFIQIMVDDGLFPSSLREKSRFKVVKVKRLRTDKGVNYRLTIRMPHDLCDELESMMTNKNLKFYWSFAKDDMSMKVICESFFSKDQRMMAKVGKYCIKDCLLVNMILNNQCTLIGSMSMASVCEVPLSYIFFNGQGIKAFSLVIKKCREEGYLIPTLEKTENAGKYKGAFVIDAIPGIYQDPIVVLDYNSLYPNSMNEKNLSTECHIKEKDREKYANLPNYFYHVQKVYHYDDDVIMLDKNGKEIYHENVFVQLKVTEQEMERVIQPFREQIQAQLDQTIQAIYERSNYTLTDCHNNIKRLQALLNKNTNQKQIKKYQAIIQDCQARIRIIEDEEEIIKQKYCQHYFTMIKKLKALHEKTFKDLSLTNEECEYLVANERKLAQDKIQNFKSGRFNRVGDAWGKYGIIPQILTQLLGKRAETKDLLELTVDTGLRAVLNALQLAYKITANSIYGQTGSRTSSFYYLPIAETTTAIGRDKLLLAKSIIETNYEGAQVIYGDTDSVFINFNIRDAQGHRLSNVEMRRKSIQYGKECEALICKQIPSPHRIVYEKMYHPLIQQSKKKYAGPYYTDNPEKYLFIHNSGTSIKCRGMCPMVKILVGGVFKHILVDNDLDQAVQHVKYTIEKVLRNEYPLTNFVLSKNLKSEYKKPQQVSHFMLAKRMAHREPGSEPRVGDRVPYAYVRIAESGRKKILQYERIEHPEFIVKHKMPLDYGFYIDHQFANPVKKILGLTIPEETLNKIFTFYVNQDKKIANYDSSLAQYMKISKQVESCPIKHEIKTKPKPIQYHSLKQWM